MYIVGSDRMSFWLLLRVFDIYLYVCVPSTSIGINFCGCMNPYCGTVHFLTLKPMYMYVHTIYSTGVSTIHFAFRHGLQLHCFMYLAT